MTAKFLDLIVKSLLLSRQLIDPAEKFLKVFVAFFHKGESVKVFNYS